MEKRPILVTLTAPTCAGKSYLFNYIRDVAKLPCIISTTTRFERENEVDGVDYYFITQEESERLEAEDQFAELAIFNGNRYGVTKQEYHSKLANGIAFLIVEPSGIEHYAKPAKDVGAHHLKYFVHTDIETRLVRFKKRMENDLLKINPEGGHLHYFSQPLEVLQKIVNIYFDRQRVMLTDEMKWGQAAQWDRFLFGEMDPEKNLAIILRDVEKLHARDAEIHSWQVNHEKVRLNLG